MLDLPNNKHAKLKNVLNSTNASTLLFSSLRLELQQHPRNQEALVNTVL
jgi:hypothetical protein